VYQPFGQGDSGGPVVIESNDLDENNTIVAINKPVGNRKKDCQWIQVGIVSWGDGALMKMILIHFYFQESLCYRIGLCMQDVRERGYLAFMLE
jgi:secreted trypsin-like serine protease